MRSPRHAPKRILCVEDHIDACELICRVLGNYEVVSAHTIDEAREKCNGQKFSLILLDYLLPDGDGLSFCEEIRQTDYLTPVILVSVDTELTETQVRIAGGQKLIKKHSPNFMEELCTLADNLSVTF